MNTEAIIKKELGFLIEEYGFNFSYRSDGKQVWCTLANQYGSVNWYSFEEFDEYELSVVGDKGKIVLDSPYRCEKVFYNRLNLFERLFRVKGKTYWSNVSAFFKEQIAKTCYLFGLRLRRNSDDKGG